MYSFLEFPLLCNRIGGDFAALEHRFDTPPRWVKDPVLCRSRLQLGSDPWWELCMLQGRKKKKEKKDNFSLTPKWK